MSLQTKFDEWLAQSKGKALSIDNNNSLDCVDVPKSWATFLFNVSWVQTIGYGNAKDLYNNASSNYFDKIPNSPTGVPNPGDIIVWGTGIGIYGHIAVVIWANVNTFMVLEQDSYKQIAAYQRQWPNYSAVIGWLRPKYNDNGGTMDPQIIQNADNWFARCNKTIMFTRGRQMSRDEFAPQVGRKFINFVEDAEDAPEADANLRTIEIGKANKIQDTTYWYQVTDKLMLTARGRKWATNNEFKLQVDRSFIDTVNDIFSGPEYEAHQRRVIDALSNNTTLQTQITTLQSELNQCRANQGSGVSQATVDTINETNGIVKAIKVTVDFIKTFLTSIFRGGN